jgi:hypothetical protein
MGETSTTPCLSNWYRRWSKWHRIWPGLVPFTLPVIYYAIVGSSVLYLLPLDQKCPSLEADNFKHEGFDVISNDITPCRLSEDFARMKSQHPRGSFSAAPYLFGAQGCVSVCAALTEPNRSPVDPTALNLPMRHRGDSWQARASVV